MAEGKLIVIEGQDGTGKETQARMLVDRINRSRMRAEYMQFPRYGTSSAWLIERYLGGDETIDRSPGAASLYYLIDRLNAAFEIRQRLAAGVHVVADRYTASNAGHQGGRIALVSERVEFFHWLWKLEFETFNIPRPAINVLLSMPAEMSIRLMRERDRTPDAHERDAKHLAAAAQSYEQVARVFPEDFLIIKCTHGERVLSPEAIHVDIWGRLLQYF